MFLPSASRRWGRPDREGTMSKAKVPEWICTDVPITGLIDAVGLLCNYRHALYTTRAEGKTAKPEYECFVDRLNALNQLVRDLSLSACATISKEADAPLLHSEICAYVDTIQKCSDDVLREQRRDSALCTTLTNKLEAIEAIRHPEIRAVRARLKEREQHQFVALLKAEGGTAYLDALNVAFDDASRAKEEYRREVEAVVSGGEGEARMDLKPCIVKAGGSLESAIKARDELTPEAGERPSKKAWEWVREHHYAKGKCPAYETWCRYIRAYYADGAALPKRRGERITLTRSMVRAKDEARK